MATYWEIAAYSAYDMFSWYKYLIVNLGFSNLGFWIENLFLSVFAYLYYFCHACVEFEPRAQFSWVATSGKM